ncbi:MAG: AAA family ATPase [Muribaculaceae bacterium]|nr:AAA family ATPase [Muribaculaceae bacterium]
MAITINTGDLKTILETTPSTQNILLVGKHGIGKSEIITRHFEDQGIPVIALFLGQMSDPGDLIGLPNKDEKTGKTEFMPPYWFPMDDKPVVLFLDEMNRARPEILQSVMDLSLNRKLAGRSLPPGSRVIAAVNDGEEYQLTDLDPALVSRFNVYFFSPTVGEWLFWAKQHDVDQRVITFIEEHPDELEKNVDINKGTFDKTPDRRAWVRVSGLLKSMSITTDTDMNCLAKMITGVIGARSASMFMQSLNQSRMLTAREVLTDFGACQHELASYTMPQMAIINEGIYQVLELGVDKKATEAVGRNLVRYIQWMLGNGRQEAIAHFASFFENATYPNANAFIMMDCREALALINQMINDL